jgi:Mg2+/Co2+ transporter CorB
MNYDVLWAVGSIVALIIVSAFFSGSETGLTTASRARLNEMEKRGSRRAAAVLKLTANPERLIGALLLGNTLANVMASALATEALAKLSSGYGALIVSAGLTVIILIFAEVMPKTYAIAYPDRVALAVAPIIRLIAAILGPVVMVVEYIVKKTLMLFGVDTSNVESILSAHDELRGAIDLHHKEGTFIKKDRDMLGGILDLKDLEVADIMVHRTKMTTIDGSEPISSIIQQVFKSGNTRLPVWQDNPDNIVGILHAKNLFAAIQENDGDSHKVKLEDILSPAWFVPDTRPLTDQLNAFLRRKTHFAIVVDEYGEVQGLITLEDIIEEIVGDIKDEFDAVTTGVRKQHDGSYNIEGTVPLRDLNRSFDWNLPDEEVTTVAGLVIHEARMIPEAGQVFTFHGFRFEVLKKRKQQLSLINVTKLEPAKEELESG